MANSGKNSTTSAGSLAEGNQSCDTEFVSLLRKTNTKRAASNRQIGEKLRPTRSSARSSPIDEQITQNTNDLITDKKASVESKSAVLAEITCPMISSSDATSLASNSSQPATAPTGGSATTGTKKYQKPRRRVATLAQRRAANIRERRRMFNLNAAFDRLRKKVPSFAYEKRLSRIETLKLAIMYIKFMDDLVNDDAYAEKYKQLTANTDMNGNTSSAFLSSGSYLSFYSNARCMDSPSPTAHVNCGPSSLANPTVARHIPSQQQQQQQVNSSPFPEKMIKNHQARQVISSASPRLINGQDGTNQAMANSRQPYGARCSGSSFCLDSCCSGGSTSQVYGKMHILNAQPQQQSEPSPMSSASMACCSSPASSSSTTTTCNSSNSTYNESSPELTSPTTLTLPVSVATTSHYSQQTSSSGCAVSIYANPISSAYYCEPSKMLYYDEPKASQLSEQVANSRRLKHLAGEEPFAAQQPMNNHQQVDLTYACQQQQQQQQQTNLQQLHPLQQSQQHSAAHQQYSLHSLQAR